MEEITVFDAETGDSIDHLVQWDRNIKIFFEDSRITKNYSVHFFNEKSDEAYVVNDTSFADGKLTVKIPNVLLVEPYAIFGYINVSNVAEDLVSQNYLYNFRINVRKRPVPMNFVFEDDLGYVTFEEVLSEAKAYADNAKESQDAAYASEQAAKGSESKATEQATKAESEATKATEQATKAESEATKATEQANKAESEATKATEKATAAEDSAGRAKESETSAQASSKLSESWAVGGTDTRDGEDENNSKYYAEQSANSATSASDSAEKAETAKAGAEAAREGIEESLQQAKSSAGNAAASAEEAENWQKQAQSWAVGEGWPERENQSTDNAKAYAQKAAQSATQAGASATKAENAKTAAEEAKTSAETSAAEAKKDREAIENMTADAETSEPGTDADVEKQVQDDGSVNLHFTIPRGEPGLQVGIDALFCLEVDENGDLYAYYDDGKQAPSFEFHDDTGELYYIFEYEEAA